MAYCNIGDTERVILTLQTFSNVTKVTMSFDIAKGNVSGKTDKFNIYASRDCKKTWTNVYPKKRDRKNL